MGLYEFGPFQLDLERMLLLANGLPVPLGPKVVETLCALVEHPGDVLAKSRLLERIWPEGYIDEANLAQNVYVLRKTLRAYWDAEAIQTVPRRGYRFVGTVFQREHAPPAQPLAMAVTSPPGRASAGTLAGAVIALAFAAVAAIAIFGPRSQTIAGAALPQGTRLYELGHYYWNLRTPASIRLSLRYFAKLVKADPRDARGYAALAAANAMMGDYGYGPTPPGVSFARARAYARKALAIDSNDAQAYAVLGMIETDRDQAGTGYRMAQGLHDLRRAIALDPASGSAREWYGVALLQQGRVHEAYAQLREAAGLDPLSVATAAWLGHAAYLERRYADAIGYAREAIDLSPHRADVYLTLGLAYEAQGERNTAADVFARLASFCRRCRPEVAALMADLYARANDVRKARAELAIAQAHAADVAPDDLAVALAAVGERVSALNWLRRAPGGYTRVELTNDPRFAVLRNG